MSAYLPRSLSSSPAVSSLLEQAELWSAESQHPRARDFYRFAIQQDSGCGARLRFAEYLSQYGQTDEALSELLQALEIARSQRNHRARAAVCHQLAMIYRDRGETAAACSFQQQEIAARLADPSLESEETPPCDFLALAKTALFTGDLDSARQLAEHALKFAQSQNCPGGLADAWSMWGEIQFRQSEIPAAWRGYLNAYILHSRAGDESDRAADLVNLARVCRGQGWWLVAKHLLMKANRILQNAGLTDAGLQIKSLLHEAEQVLAVSERTPQWN